MVDIQAKERFKQPISLNEIRGNYLLSEMLLLRRGMRLSVQPISEEHYAIICHLGQIDKI